MPGWLNDVRHGLRAFLQQPLLALVAVGTLAIGVGANVAVLSVIKVMFVDQLNVPRADELVNLEVEGRKSLRYSNDLSGGMESVFSYPLFEQMARPGVEGVQVAAHRNLDVDVVIDGQPERRRATVVSGRYFPTLDLRPELGRLLDASDASEAGQAAAVVLAYRFWQSRFAGDPDVLGRAMRINGRVLEIVGVAPQGFAGISVGIVPDMFVPLTLPAPPAGWLPEHHDRDMHWLYLFARIAPGHSPAVVQAQLDSRFSRLWPESVEPAGGERMQRLLLAPGARGQSMAPERMRQPVLLAQAAAVLLLLIACVNLANQQLARGIGRVGAMAVRATLGASRGRLLRQALVEPVAIALLGALAAWPVMRLVGRLMSALMQGDLPLPEADGHAFGLSLAVALSAVVLFGLYPAMRLSAMAPMTAIGKGHGSVGRHVARLRTALVIVQLAFSMAALTLGMLLAQSLFNLERVHLGIRSESLTTFTVEPVRAGYAGDQVPALVAGIERELTALAGVESVSHSMTPLLADAVSRTLVRVDGGEAGASTFNLVAPGFLHTVGGHLLAGRDFNRDDGAGVALVNRRFVEQFGLGNQVLGRRLELGDESGIEIIGLFEDMAYGSVRASAPPLVLRPNAGYDPYFGNSISFYVRSAGASVVQAQRIADLMRGLAPDLPLLALRTMPEQIRENISRERVFGVTAAVLAFLVTVLAASGLFSVLSFSLAQRRRELGLRLALGAEPVRLRLLVFAQVLRMGTAGIFFGAALALLSARVLQSVLFEVSGHDGEVLVVAAVLLAAVMVMAAWRPALRASRTDPMVALRYE